MKLDTSGMSVAVKVPAGWRRVLSHMGVLLALTAMTGVAGGCGGKNEAIKTTPEDSASWRHRGIWVEKKGDISYVMVVGTSSSASLDHSMSMDTAEQDARERAAIFLGATVQAFRERMTRRREIAAKRSDGEVAKAAEQTTQTDRGGRTIAEQAIRGMETINSFTDSKEDTLYVLARVDLQSLRNALATDPSLTDAERDAVTKDSNDVRNEMNAALDEARSSAKK